VARYAATVESAATLAADTGFAWLNPVSTCGAKLRRVTAGIITTTAVVPTSQQVVLGIARATNAGTTPGGLVTPAKLDPNSAAASCTFATTYATPPTLTSPDQYKVAFNSQSGVDLPFELLEEFIVAASTNAGLAFINRDIALPTNHKLVLAVEWEE
jgi:hypothetical protein